MSESNSSIKTTASVLILLAHPTMHRSRLNRALLDAVDGQEGVAVHDLYEHYPDFYVDIDYERYLLLQSDVVVFQFPFYWYSAPALLRQWQDSVLLPDRAFLDEDHELAGKSLLCVVTTGHRAETYQRGGRNNYTMEEFLYPFEQLASHCGMRYLEPVLVHGTRHLSDEELAQHAQGYSERLKGLVDGEHSGR